MICFIPSYELAAASCGYTVSKQNPDRLQLNKGPVSPGALYSSLHTGTAPINVVEHKRNGWSSFPEVTNLTCWGGIRLDFTFDLVLIVGGSSPQNLVWRSGRFKALNVLSLENILVLFVIACLKWWGWRRDVVFGDWSTKIINHSALCHLKPSLEKSTRSLTQPRVISFYKAGT